MSTLNAVSGGVTTSAIAYNQASNLSASANTPVPETAAPSAPTPTATEASAPADAGTSSGGGIYTAVANVNAPTVRGTNVNLVA